MGPNTTAEVGGRINGHLKAVGIVDIPYLYPCALYNSTTCSLPGITYEVLYTLSVMLNFTFHIEESNVVDHDDFVMREINSTSFKNEYNISATLVPINSDHSENVQFSHSIMYYRKSFAIATPNVHKLNFLLTLPFDTVTWFCLIGVVSTIAALLSSASFVLDDSRKQIRFSHNLWTIVSSVCKPLQSYRVSAHPFHSLITFLWQAFKTILVSAYGASLISFIMNDPQANFPFNSSTGLAALLESGAMKLVTTLENNMHNPLSSVSSVNQQIMQRINQSIDKHGMIVVKNVQHALNMLKNDTSLVFIDYNTNLQIWLDVYQICGVSIIEDNDEPVHHLAFVFSKLFRFTESMQRATAEIASSAYVQRLFAKYSYHRSINCTAEQESNVVQLLSLSMQQTNSIFILLICGSFIALILFIVERIKYANFNQKVINEHMLY